MKATMTFLAAAGALLIAPGLAHAADEYGHNGGVKVEGGAGVLTYRNDGAAAGLFSPGPQYGVHLDFNPIGAMGLEVGYQGAAYGIQGGDGTVVENGADAVLKLGPKLGAVEPYALGGYGVTRLTANGAAESAGVTDDWIQKVPVGAGVDFAIPAGANPLLLGARGTYNFLLNNDAFGSRANNTGDRGNDQIGGELMLGGKF
jgi:hypothetical protein